MNYTKKQIILVLTLSFLTALFLFRDSFSSFFFQDDWFTLSASQANSVVDFFRFFIPRTDIIYYRPFGMQLVFFLIQKIFGINPFPFRILTLITHLINIILVYLLSREICKKDNVSLLTSFFYAVSATHFMPFFWSSTYPFILAPSLFFSSFYFFIRNIKSGKNHFLLISFLLFFLGLFTNEIIFTLPIVLLLYLFVFAKKMHIRKTLLFFATSISLFVLRFVFFSPPRKGVYSLSIAKNTLNNLQAYLLWSFNLPDEIKAQLVSFYQLNPEFIKNFKFYSAVFIVSLVLNLLLLYLPTIFLLAKNKKGKIILTLLFAVGWFIACLLPVLFFPHHSFSYYLPISLVGLLLFSASSFFYWTKSLVKNNFLKALLLAAISINFLAVSFATIEFNKKVHWAPRRAIVAKQLIDKAKKIYKKDIKTIYVLDTTENRLSLNEQDGLKVFFNDKDLKTIYTNDIKKKVL